MREVERDIKMKIAKDMEKKKEEYIQKMERLRKESEDLSEDEYDLPEREKRIYGVQPENKSEKLRRIGLRNPR